jgi:hypothetical protein
VLRTDAAHEATDTPDACAPERRNTCGGFTTEEQIQNPAAHVS